MKQTAELFVGNMLTRGAPCTVCCGGWFGVVGVNCVGRVGGFVVFGVVVVVFWAYCGVVSVLEWCFRHAVGTLSLQRFGRCFVMLICACVWCRVCLSLAAAERSGSFRLVGFGLVQSVVVV